MSAVLRATIGVIISVLVAVIAVPAHGQTGPVQILNPNWNITLTDAGYSDWLYDNTPGYQGREYLSGEWGAAVAYVKGSGSGATVVTPTWLQPQFLFPDWVTNSTFATVPGHEIAVTGQDFGGLDARAASRIANSDLQIDLTFEMIDTVIGMAMGTSPASATTGTFIESNRYVLRQTYSITNISGDTIHSLNLFQFLHSLNGVSSVYDSHAYAAALPEYRYDTTQIAIDPTYSGSGGITFRDYINFAASQAPVAFDNGRYGVEGVDDHSIGKPSVGIHISVENDALANLELFSPVAPDPVLWVGGAQKYSLPDLANGASIAIDVMLSIKTGTILDNTGPVSGSANGGSGHPGGIDFTFDNVTQIGDFFAEYEACDAAEIAARVAAGEFTVPTFSIPGPLQLYELEYTGAYTGNITLTFGYDATLLPTGFDETQLAMYHFRNDAWQSEGGSVDPVNHTITITVTSLGDFGLGTAAPHGSRTITQWRSARSHNTLGRVAIVLDPLASGNGRTGPTVEPRGPSAGDCGIQRIEVEFDGNIGLANPGNISVVGRTTVEEFLGPPVNYTPSSVSVSGDRVLVIRFDPGVLPDQSCYTITIGADTLDETIVGDNDCSVRSLFGDTTGSGDVCLSDALLVQSRAGLSAADYPQCDVDLSGGLITVSDALTIKNLIASPEISALCQ